MLVNLVNWIKLKVEQWKKDNPKSKFFSQPYKEYDDPASEQTLLYIHQEPWQQDLMVKYGNTISLIDATYKTTRYELAHFFVAVKTNVGYTAVADFIVQSETAEQISQALKMLSSWNPDWKPPYFMSDFSEAEMGAIATAFPNSKVYLCDFHREQTWERWVKDRKHGLSVVDGDSLLCLLRDLAQAPSLTDDQPVDHFYQKQVKNLKESKIWKENSSVREWLQGKWLCSPEVRILYK